MKLIITVELPTRQWWARCRGWERTERERERERERLEREEIVNMNDEIAKGKNSQKKNIHENCRRIFWLHQRGDERKINNLWQSIKFVQLCSTFELKAKKILYFDAKILLMPSNWPLARLEMERSRARAQSWARTKSGSITGWQHWKAKA